MAAVNSGYEISEVESMTNRTNGLETNITNSKWTNSGVSTDQIIVDEKNRSKLKWRIYISVFFMCWSRLISFAGGTAIETTQSSLNSENGLGTASLAIKTASMIVQTLFLNSLCIKKLGLKGSLVVGLCLEIAYPLANFYPQWWTLTLGAIISGLGRAMHATAEPAYLSRISRIYVDKVLNTPGAPSDVVKTRFINYYFVFYMASRIVGNVASSLILGSGLNNFSLSNLKTSNSSANDDQFFCGANYCDATNNSSLLLAHHQQSPINATINKKTVESSKVYSLVGYAMGSYVLAIVIILLFVVKLDKLNKNDDKNNKNSFKDGGKVAEESKVLTKPGLLLFDTVRLWRNPNQLLLLPLSFYNGMDDSFFGADFTKSFVSCPFGIQWIGFTAAWYGITSPLIVLLCTALVKPSLRPIPFFIALGCHLGCGITMLNINSLTLTTSFTLSATWGIASGLWPYALNAFYGIVFESTPEAAFSNYWLCNSIGATIIYSWSYYLCTSTKIYILMSLLSISFIGYIIVEIRYRRQLLKKFTNDCNQTTTMEVNQQSCDQDTNF
ncbi:Protein unc-93 A [Chamberlinius hualienensis]